MFASSKNLTAFARGRTLKGNTVMDLDFNDVLNEHAGHMLFVSGIAGIRQRQMLIEGQRRQSNNYGTQITDHRQHIEFQRKQVSLMEEHLRVERNTQRAQEEQLQIEQFRLAADQAERAWQRQQAASQMEQAERVRLIRNLIADSISELHKLKKLHA